MGSLQGPGQPLECWQQPGSGAAWSLWDRVAPGAVLGLWHEDFRDPFQVFELLFAHPCGICCAWSTQG